MYEYSEETKQMVFHIMDKLHDSFEEKPIGRFTVEFIPTHNRINAISNLDETKLFTPEIASQLSYDLILLREQMYTKNQGAWFNCIIVLNPTIEDLGNFQIAFNYTEMPKTADGTTFPIENVIEDLEMHPREESAIPEWLKLELIYRAESVNALTDENTGDMG